MPTARVTTLYLCLEDSTLRIQTWLFDITEDAPANVHFCTESLILGQGLVEQLKAFLAEHPDTVLVIIDTLQMVRGVHCNNAYANDYWDLSALKRIADGHGISLLLIHHLRKELADDVFSRISGTAAMGGAVGSSFTLVPDSREQPEYRGDRVIFLLSTLMEGRAEFIGTPTELVALIDHVGTEGVTSKTVSRRILQNIETLSKCVLNSHHGRINYAYNMH